MTTRADEAQDGLYLQVYPSTLVNASRMGKIGRSVQDTGIFRETHLVGVHAEDQPPVEDLGAGLSIHRIRGSGRRGNLGRVLRVLLWQPRVFQRYRRQPVALVAAHNIWVLPMCWLLSRRTGARLIYNAHELETETAAITGFKQVVAKQIESRFIRRCALVSVVNDPIADWYRSAYGIPRPVVVGNVPTVVDAEVGFRERLGVGADEMLYVHTGHLVSGRNIPLILEAFSGSPHHVVFLGDGPYRADIEAAARAHPNIHWVPPVEPELIVAHVREGDVGLCLIQRQVSLSDRLSSPNKLMEALAAGIPALCTDLVEARRALGADADRWILTDETALAAAIAEITQDDSARFRASWPGVRPWDQEVAGLTTAIGVLMGRDEAEADGAGTYDVADVARPEEPGAAGAGSERK